MNRTSEQSRTTNRLGTHRESLVFTLGLAAVAAATTWATLLSWRTFVTEAAPVTIPLFFIAALIAGIGGAARWLRLPLLVPLAAQLVVGAACVLGSVTGSIAPTPGTIDEFVTKFGDAITSAQAYVAPIPSGVPPITAILLTSGVGILIVVDLLAGALRRIPLAGLALLTVYSVPVSITGNGVSWLTFILMAVGFLSMLYLVHAEQIARWGRGVGGQPGRDDDTDPTAFGVRTGAVRSSALAIGTTATTLALAVPLLVPTLNVTLFDGSGPGNREIEVADPMVDLRRDLDRGQDIPLMWVTTSQKNSPSYFKLATLTRFNGETWTPGDRDIPETQVARGEMPPLVGVASGTARKETQYHVRISDEFRSEWLPTTPQVSSMSVVGDWRYDTSTMDFMSIDDSVTTAGMTYQFTGVDVDPDPELLDDAVSGAASVRSAYLEVPTNISSEVRTLAASVTGGESTRFRQARALQQWFREDGGFRYDDRNIADDPGSLTAFLDESGRVGYCEQFAASMAIMARILGIPARVAVGFLNSTPAGANQYEFSSHDLHAWPELFFPGAGWVRFEPTPSTRAETVPSYTSADLAPEATATPTPSASKSTELLPSRGATPGATTASDDGSGFPWTVVLLVALGVLLVAALVLLPSFVRRKRRDRRLFGTIEDLWLELRDHALDLGLGWPYGRSPRATGAWLADRFGSGEPDAASAERPRRGPEQNPDAVRALDRLVEQIERARYARSATSVDHEQAMHDVQTIEAALEHGVGPRVRRRSRWLPRSLRPTTYTPAAEVVTRATDSRETSDSLRG